MASVTIGLENEKLLKYFNEIHAALKDAEHKYNEVLHVQSKKVQVRLYKYATSKLIAALQAVIKNIQEEAIGWERKSIVGWRLDYPEIEHGPRPEYDPKKTWRK